MTLPLSLLAAHFVADFLCQTDWQATNKSKDWYVLGWHAMIYSLVVGVWALFALWSWWQVVNMISFTFWTHALTDAVTSRITSRLWFVETELAGHRWREIAEGVASETPAYYVTYKPTRHWFFVVIGFDQLIHFATLAWTLQVLA